MGTSNLKSPSITNLDAAPPTYNTSGEGAPGSLQFVNDWVTAADSDSTSSTYKMVRVPTTAKVKRVILDSAVASAGAADINVAYSDSVNDGTTPANQGTIPQISSANNKLFGAAHSLVAQSRVDITYAGTNYSAAKSNLPLWSALGLASDPGGMFDIQLNVTTQITTGGIIKLSVEYVL